MGHNPVKRSADFPDIEIVGLDWLLETIQTKKKVDEKPYKMGKSDSTVAATAKGNDKGKKRSHNGKIKSEAPESDEEEQAPLAKKQKDAQIAKSRAIQIPVDEGCENPGKE